MTYIPRSALVEVGENVTLLDGTAYRLLYIDSAGDVKELAHGTSGQVLTANGTTSDPSWQDATGGGGMSLIVQESDQTLNSQTTLQNSELLFAVGANEVWQFEGILITSTGSTPDIKIAAVGPTGAVGSLAAIASAIGGNGVYASSDQLGTAISLTTASTEFVRFWGAIHNGANAGNLTIQFAQNTSDASNTTVYAGSYMKWMAES